MADGLENVSSTSPASLPAPLAAPVADGSETLSAQHKPPRRSKKAAKVVPDGVLETGRKDDDIMNTNNSSITSKRSVEKLYYPQLPEFFRCFVRKFQRRSPLINRGYWLRMAAIDKTVINFLKEPGEQTKLVINLGCGYDPLPFQFLGGEGNLCQSCVFIDVDYPQLMKRKVDVIERSPVILETLPGFARNTDEKAAVLGRSEKYIALGCNLNSVESLDRALRQLLDIDSSSIAILFVAEVSVAYMELKAADDLLRWAARLRDARFCLLEQHLPDGPGHPFAQTMLKHFRKLNTPLNAIGTLAQMRSRFQTAGWASDKVSLRTLWELWSDNDFLRPNEREVLDEVEPFDEWEEFALFGAHYFLLVARTCSSSSSHERAESCQNPSAEKAAESRISSPVSGAPIVRRFGAASVTSAPRTDQNIGHWGGLGAQQRLSTSEAFTAFKPAPPHLRNMTDSLMCHTITQFSTEGSMLLLVGGRASPDKASSACHILDSGSWRPTFPLPVGRYRHSATQVRIRGTAGEQASESVLIFGGKSSDRTTLNDWLVYDHRSGWKTLTVTGDGPVEPRFGAAMATSLEDGASGMLLGGMRSDGSIVDECFTWALKIIEDELVVECKRIKWPEELLPTCRPARFGAQLVATASGMILIGGIATGPLLSRDEEIVNLSSGSPIHVEYSDRPLLVGMAVVAASNGDVLVLGGGATCFSFGTCWSYSFVLHGRETDQPEQTWRLDDTKGEHTDTKQQKQPTTTPDTNGSAHEPAAVPTRTLSSAQEFESILLASTPVVLRGLDIGPCTTKWTPSYLAEHIGRDRRVVVHEATTPAMDFATKNFTYRSMAFGDFLAAASGGAHVYLRALSASRPSEAPADLAGDFPGVAGDFRLPPALAAVERRKHSSPLRISGAAGIWPHYDVMSNVLCQIRGRRRLRLYRPRDVVALGVAAGASSSGLDAFDETAEAALRAAGVEAVEAALEEGDVLFIPALWLHSARPVGGVGVAVNVFFRDERLEAAYAAGRDVYGNRDLAAYERGRRDVQRVAKAFEGLPPQVREFYIRRLAQELLDAR